MTTAKGWEFEVSFSVEREDREVSLTIHGNVTPHRRATRTDPAEGGDVEIVEILAPVDGTWSKLCPPKWDGELTEQEHADAEEKLQETAQEEWAARYEDAGDAEADAAEAREDMMDDGDY